MGYAVCLLNVMASEGPGAAYLTKLQETKDDGLTRLLVSVMKNQKGDTNLRQNALAALQKLSLHRRPQTIMIESDCIRWIANTLRSVCI